MLSGLNWHSQIRKRARTIGMSRVKEFVRRISSHDLEQYPDWDLSRPLPRLPVPDLRVTLNRYLRLVAPNVTAKDFERTRLLVEEFGRVGGEGEKLQASLKALAEKKVNWVSLAMFCVNKLHGY
ncbi:unnamed protein product [Protopolystoma xenopodis]|uniref:Choline/carnitine acyltransferase domain-containing protein n=1 Tax=Protopolystoma xenopodis TaxID=117903 RepID=A0A3S5BQD2_9PLAT|nr:unnamed protein product [Protopolystoma xenopodis]